MLGIKIWHDYFLHTFFMFIQINNANQLPFNQILADRIYIETIKRCILKIPHILYINKTINTEPDN